MSIFTLVTALLIERFRPLAYKQVVAMPVYAMSQWLEKNFNAGRYRHGVLAWCLAVLPLTVLSGLVFYLLDSVSIILAWLWNVLLLYLTLGFRQFSSYFSSIQRSLADGEIITARELLAEWLRQPNHQIRTRQTERMVISELGASEIARLSIEEALSASHRHVFGVLLFFILLPGPTGAVLYRLSVLLAEAARNNRNDDNDEFNRFTTVCLRMVDWLPARLTAMSLAVCGNFEDAAHCWRNQAQNWPDKYDPNLGVILASGAGALGVRFNFVSFNIPRADNSEFGDEPVLGDDEQPLDHETMQRAVGLVWRAILLWLCLMLGFTIAQGLGAMG